MSKRKDMAGKDDERQVRGKRGPSSATPNERARPRKGGAKDASRAVPKVGKGDVGKTGSRGGGLH